MKALDSKIASWLKPVVTQNASTPVREKAASDYFELRKKVANSQLGILMDRLKLMVESHASVAGGPETWLQTILEFRNVGCNRIAHTVAIGRAAELAALDFSKVAHVLPDLESVEAWRKHAKRPVLDFARELNQDPKTAYENATADWLLAHGKPANLPPLLRMFFTRTPRPAPLKAWDAALGAFLQKDPKAERLAAAVTAAGNEATELDALATAVRSSPETMLAVTKSLAVLAARRGAVFPGGAFIRSLFIDLPITKGKGRRQACAMLALLTGSLLRADALSTTGQEMLAVVAALGEELRNSTRAADLQKDTWVVQPLSTPESESSACLTIDGARRWAIVYERVMQEKQPVAALEVLGYNLGLREIGERGQVVSYVPREHDDTEGGLLPGATVEIVVPGWSFDSHPIIRARIRACTPKPCTPPSSASI
jgi:hypothetical protein